jgi:hypothetical protein
MAEVQEESLKCYIHRFGVSYFLLDIIIKEKMKPVPLLYAFNYLYGDKIQMKRKPTVQHLPQFLYYVVLCQFLSLLVMNHAFL